MGEFTNVVNAISWYLNNGEVDPVISTFSGTGYRTLILSNKTNESDIVKTITLGSDPIPWEHISELVEKGATVICNWGMSEIGPCAINKTYDKNNVWETFYESPDLTILGNTFYCDWKIEDDILYVKGDISIYDDWYKTKDIVYRAGTKNYTLYYKGRSVT